MKNPNRDTVSRLDALPNIGRAISTDLIRINLTHPNQLIGRNAYKLHGELCTEQGVRVDPCVIDVLLSAIDFMEGGEPKPWWHFTDERKWELDSQELGRVI